MIFRKASGGRLAAARWAALAGAGLAAAVACRHGVRFEPIPQAEAAAVGNPHHYRGQPLCQRCHVPGKGLIAAPVALCKPCHAFQHLNHPLDVPVMADPGLPLWEGRIACSTCHDPHDVATLRAGLRLESPELCLRCHRTHRRQPSRRGG